MEDVLEFYAGPHDPDRTVVCFDESSKELLGDVAGPGLDGQAGLRVHPARHGQPIRDRRALGRVAARDGDGSSDDPRLRRPDEISLRRDVSGGDDDPGRADNLNTHAYGLLFATYPPEETWRLGRRLEFHFTPKHASWLNMAECKLSVLGRQCLDRRLSSKEAVAAEGGPWEGERNRLGVRLVWSFRVTDVRRKLAHL
jgi:hypothetical protein